MLPSLRNVLTCNHLLVDNIREYGYCAHIEVSLVQATGVFEWRHEVIVVTGLDVLSFSLTRILFRTEETLT